MKHLKNSKNKRKRSSKEEMPLKSLKNSSEMRLGFSKQRNKKSLTSKKNLRNSKRSKKKSFSNKILSQKDLIKKKKSCFH